MTKTLLERLRRINLTQWIFIGLVSGLTIGLCAPDYALTLKPLRNLFLNGVKCIIAPLIFATIVTGIAGAGSFQKLGLLGIRTLVYFEAVTTMALFFGLAVVNILKPGVGLNLIAKTADPSFALPVTQQITLGGFVEHLLPSSFAEAIVHGDVLQVVIFSTLFGFSILAVGEKARPVLTFCESLSEIMFRFTGFIMFLAPLGVGAAIATGISEHGFQVMLPMAKLMASLLIALVLFVLAVFYPILLIFKIPVKGFVLHVKDAVILAFATTSSESAYPLAMDSMEKFGVPRRITSFVLPMGYSFNLDGSTLYLGIASVFAAQAVGLDLPLSTQLAMMASLMLTSKGVAAVPRTSFVVLSGTLTAFGVPLDALALILAVDAFMDMARTSVNLLGNCLATTVMARVEGIELGGTPIPVVEPMSKNLIIN
jgi:proton glutamate symport protein